MQEWKQIESQLVQQLEVLKKQHEILDQMRKINSNRRSQNLDKTYL